MVKSFWNHWRLYLQGCRWCQHPRASKQLAQVTKQTHPRVGVIYPYRSYGPLKNWIRDDPRKCKTSTNNEASQTRLHARPDWTCRVR